ncbi:ATPase, partial [Streptomyces sp. T-3]|nr:ATPase [Streptomyces sp. T-3]
ANGSDSRGAAGHSTATDTEGPDDNDGLPRRVRQTHLAPQLREEPTADEHPTPSNPRNTSQEPDERTPEQVRDRMAAYREGWARGGRPPGKARGANGARAQGSDSSEGDDA